MSADYGLQSPGGCDGRHRNGVTGHDCPESKGCLNTPGRRVFPLGEKWAVSLEWYFSVTNIYAAETTAALVLCSDHI